MLALALEPGLRLLGLVGPDEVLGKGLVYHSEARGNRSRVVRGAIFPQEELQDVDGYIRADLDLTNKVLADHPSRECVVRQAIELVHRGGGRGLRHRSSSTT